MTVCYTETMKKRAEHPDTFSTRRMEALTDGVFAIAMTLLILDIKVSDFGNIVTNTDLLNALVNESGSLISFVVSFLMLGSMWAVHTRQFEYITRTDRRLTMINTLRLLAVVFLPLTTSIAGAYADIMLGRVLLPLNFFVIIALGYWQWQHAVKNKTVLAPDISEQIASYATRRNLIISIIALAATILSLLIGQFAFLLFALSPILMKYSWRHRP